MVTEISKLHRIELTAFLPDLPEAEVDQFCNALTDWIAEHGADFYTLSARPVDPETGEDFK